MARTIRVHAREYGVRESAIAAAYASSGHMMKDIGDYFGLHYSRVSKIVRAGSQYRSRAKGKT